MDKLKSEKYQQPQQLLKPQTQGSPFPTVFADDRSVVTNRDITDIQAKSLCFKIEVPVVSNPGSHSCGNFVPQADYTALGNSVICADKISGVTADVMDFSVSMKPPQEHAGAVKDTPPPPQGPAGKWIIEHKVELIDSLKTDGLILQEVHEKRIVTHRQYERLKHVPQPEQSVIDLIDLVISNGEKTCVQFLQVLKDREVLQTYTQLEGILKKIET